MLSKFLLSALLLCAPVALASISDSTNNPNFTQYTLTADGITAQFIPYGARLTHLLVKDRKGQNQDVVAGYDNPLQYLKDTETNHTYFGAIVGRYANRIKNGTFTIDGVTSHIPENEHGGEDTLHGGSVGYDQRNWTVVTHNASSITFSLLDTAFQGFPGTVITYASFSLSNVITGPFGLLTPRMTTKTVSVALDQQTPIMLANHIYWNLDGFGAQTILNDTLWMPYADRYIEIDTIEVPTGQIATVSSNPTLDFTAPKTIGANISEAKGLCGYNCTGYDNAFILDRPESIGSGPESAAYPTLTMWSNLTGIKLDVSTNQRSFQIYSCNGQNGTIPVKESQLKRNQNRGVADPAKFVNKYGCLVIETQQWIDGINNLEWGQEQYQVYGPNTGPAVNFATYDFSTF